MVVFSDLETVLSLMADDVIFMVPGKEPFGKEAFAARSGEMEHHKIDGTGDIKEIKVLGDWAWMRNHLQITITQPNGKLTRRSGYVLTILRKNPDGAWVNRARRKSSDRRLDRSGSSEVSARVEQSLHALSRVRR
jgi:uncharacterized protein (TIGR02246 family)